MSIYSHVYTADRILTPEQEKIRARTALSETPNLKYTLGLLVQKLEITTASSGLPTQ